MQVPCNSSTFSMYFNSTPSQNSTSDPLTQKSIITVLVAVGKRSSTSLHKAFMVRNSHFALSVSPMGNYLWRNTPSLQALGLFSFCFTANMSSRPNTWPRYFVVTGHRIIKLKKSTVHYIIYFVKL